MPVFEVQHNGKTYEVDAPDAATAATAFGPAQQAPLADRVARAQSIAKTGQPLPPELAGDKDVLNAMTQGFARQNQEQSDYGPDAQARNVQAAVDTEKGVPEGARRLWAGLKQTGAEVKDAYNLLVHGKPSQSDVAVRNPDGSLLRRDKETLDSSASKPVIAEELLRRQVQEQTDLDAGASKLGRNAAAKTVELGALALGPEAALPRATTLTGGMLKNSAAGAIGGGLEFDAKPNNNAAIGAGLAPVFGVIPSVVPAVKNYIGRALSRVQREGRTAGRVANASATLPNVEYSLAQVTGVPELKTLERAAYDSKMVNFYADQTDKFVKDTVSALRQPMKEGQELSNDFVAARTKADTSLRSFKRAANDNYEAGITSARARASEDNPTARIPVQRFTQEADAVLSEAEATAERGLGRPLTRKYIEHLRSVLHKPDKGLDGVVNVNELADTLVDLTKLQKHEDPQVRALGSRMRAALDDDMDKLEGNATFAADDATKELLETRAEYRRAQQLIGELSDSAAYKLLGVKDPQLFDATETMEKLKGFSPEKRASIRDFLNENSPDLLVSLKDATVRDAAKKAHTIREAADSQQDLDQMMDGMFDAKNGYDMRTSGLWNSEELKHIEGIKDGMRVIANNRPRLGGSGTPIKPEDVAINLVARHSAFMARQMTRILTSTKASQFFTDPRVYERLTKMKRSTTGSPTNMIARAALLDLMQDDYQTEEAQ
jgi:hypothetical protein